MKKLLIAVALWSVAAGCRREKPEVRPQPLPRSFAMLWSEPGGLDPACVDDAEGGNVVSQVFDGLLGFDSKLNLVPELARRWTVSPDGRIYTFELEPQARFHNGRRVVAQDFVNSFMRLLRDTCGHASIGREFLEDVVGVPEYLAGRQHSVAGLRAPDEGHFVMELREPDSMILKAMAMPNFKVVPKEAVGPDFAHHPVGSGPFVFEEWKPGNIIRLKANRDYYRGQPKIEEIDFLLQERGSPRESLELFRDGKLQMLEARGEDAEFLEKEGYPVVRTEEMTLHYVGFNCGMRPFNDTRVRQALACSLKYDRLASAQPSNYSPATGLLPPGICGSPAPARPYFYDPVQAVRLLTAAGFRDGHLDQDMEFPSYDPDDVIGSKTDNILIEGFSKLGLRLQKKFLAWPEYGRALDEQKLPIFRLAWVADLPECSLFLRSLFHTRAINNMFAYRNPDVDRLLDRAKKEYDGPRQAALCREAEQMILRDVPLIPLDFGSTTYVLQREVRGLEFSPYGISDMRMEKVWYER